MLSHRLLSQEQQENMTQKTTWVPPFSSLLPLCFSHPPPFYRTLSNNYATTSHHQGATLSLQSLRDRVLFSCVIVCKYLKYNSNLFFIFNYFFLQLLLLLFLLFTSVPPIATAN